MKTNKHSRYIKAYFFVFIFVVVISAIIRTDKPTVVFQNGELVYGIPFLVTLTFGIFGLFILLFSFFYPTPMKKSLHIIGSFIVYAQYIFLIKDVSQYPDTFNWYDGFLLAPYVLLSAESYITLDTIVTLVLPCVIIILSTLAIPAVWYYPNHCEDFLDFIETKISDKKKQKSN